MTDTRLPEHFLTSPTFDELSDSAHRVYVNGLIYSNAHGTDGALPRRALRLLHPSGATEAHVTELVGAGLWDVTRDRSRDGWTIAGFLDHQTPAASVQRARELARARKQKQREATKSRVTDGVTERVTDGVTPEDRTETGQDRTSVRPGGTTGSTQAATWPPVRAVGAEAR